MKSAARRIIPEVQWFQVASDIRNNKYRHPGVFVYLSEMTRTKRPAFEMPQVATLSTYVDMIVRSHNPGTVTRPYRGKSLELYRLSDSAGRYAHHLDFPAGICFYYVLLFRAYPRVCLHGNPSC